MIASKTLNLAGALVIALSTLAACGSESETNPDRNPAVESTTSSAAATTTTEFKLVCGPSRKC